MQGSGLHGARGWPEVVYKPSCQDWPEILEGKRGGHRRNSRGKGGSEDRASAGDIKRETEDPSGI